MLLRPITDDSNESLEKYSAVKLLFRISQQPIFVAKFDSLLAQLFFELFHLRQADCQRTMLFIVWGQSFLIAATRREMSRRVEISKGTGSYFGGHFRFDICAVGLQKDKDLISRKICTKDLISGLSNILPQ